MGQHQCCIHLQLHQRKQSSDPVRRIHRARQHLRWHLHRYLVRQRAHRRASRAHLRSQRGATEAAIADAQAQIADASEPALDRWLGRVLA